MSCGGRIYKGDAIYVSVPFDIEDYSALTISYFTSGEYKVVRTEEEVTIEDGFITAYFEGHDLDLLPDGVLRYTITCEVEGEDYVDSSNTMLYLKTPKDYDAKTAEEIWDEGYESGLTACSGSCEGVYEEGFADGVAEQKAKLVSTAITANGTYSREDGFNLIDVNVPSGGSGSYESGWTDGFASGHTDGIAEQKAKLESASFSANGTYTKEDGWNEVTVDAAGGNYTTGRVETTSRSVTLNKESLIDRTTNWGQTIYGGSKKLFYETIDHYGEIRVFSWDNPEHSDFTLQGRFWIDNGVYMWADDVILDNLTDQWTNSGGMHLRCDGTNMYYYCTYSYGYYLSDGLSVIPQSAMTLPSGYDAISAVTVSMPAFTSFDFYIARDDDNEITADSISAITLYGFQLYPESYNYDNPSTVSCYHDVLNIVGSKEDSGTTTIIQLKGSFDYVFYPYRPDEAVITLNKRVNNVGTRPSFYNGIAVNRGGHPMEAFIGIPIFPSSMSVQSGENSTRITMYLHNQ